MTGAAELLLRQTDEAYEILLHSIEGLTDEEFAWEPGPDVWRVFRDEQGRWTHDYAEPDPVPSPFTTIGWRVAHVATCKVMYHEWAFGPRRLTWLTIETPHASTARSRCSARGTSSCAPTSPAWTRPAWTPMC